jgi:hypothetical protein
MTLFPEMNSMKLGVLLQLKNAPETLSELIQQYELMNVDEVILLIDNSAPDFVKYAKKVQEEHPILTVIFDASPYKTEMHEGINMSILMNLAHMRGLDWVVHGGRNYRWIGDLKEFKHKIWFLDQLGLTHLFIKWYSMWKLGEDGSINNGWYRVDKEFNPCQRRWCGIHKVQRHTWFKMVVTHDMHPQSPYENRAYLTDFAYLHVGDVDPENRKERVNRYRTKAFGADKASPNDYSHLLTEDKNVLLMKYDEKEMIPRNVNDFFTINLSKAVKGDEI